MSNAFFKRLLITSALASSTLLGAASWAQTTQFTATYSGADTSGGACNTTYNISGEEPTAAGTYPVFIYTVGTWESPYNNGVTMTVVKQMAAKGYVAATVDYAKSNFGTCPVISGKAACIYNPNNAASAISQICSRAKADCSKGIVVAGFSQGSVVATVAKNYDSRVQAAYAIGLGDNYSGFDMTSCVAPGNRTLNSDRLRIVNGEVDNFTGTTQSAAQGTVQRVTGYTCKAGSYSCLNRNGSGWVIVKNSQVKDGQADHCYMRVGGCSPTNGTTPDSNWSSGTASWSLDPNLQWLTNFTTK